MSRDILWTGADRAFQEQIRHLEMSLRSRKWQADHNHLEMEFDELPDHLQQIYLLATAYSPDLPGGLMGPDGETVTTVMPQIGELASTYVAMRASLFAEAEYQTLRHGTTYYINQQMIDTVTEMAELAEPEPLFLTDMQSPMGFMVLQHPLLVDDLHPDTGEHLPGLRMPIRAIGWARRDIQRLSKDGTKVEKLDGIDLIVWTDDESYKKIYLEDLRRLVPERGENWHDKHRPMWMWMSDFMPWAFGSSWKTMASRDEEMFINDEGELLLASNVAYLRRWFLAFCRLCWQEIIVGDPYLPGRGLRRKRQKLELDDGVPPLPPDVRILRLRRALAHPDLQAVDPLAEPADLGTPVRRWRMPVRGHWRRQWYRSLGPAYLEDGTWNEASHRLVWIDPHFRGEGPEWTSQEITAVTR